MGLNKSTSSLKKEARGLLLGNYRSAISLLLASNLIISTLTLFIGSSGGFSLLNLIIDYLVSFILTLLSCILQVGQYSFYLKVACRQQTQFKDLFEGFLLYPDKTLWSQFLVHLLTFLSFAPGLVLIFLYAFSNVEVSLTVLFCVIIIGAILGIWIELLFSQCYFLLLDFPQLSAFNLMKKSIQLMKGHKIRLLLLQLSFLPMILLSFLTFGIGFLFIIPYQSMTKTLFYLDLIQNN